MPYSRLTVTPIMEQSSSQDPSNQMFKVSLDFKLWDKSYEYGEVTYINSEKAGEMFFYDKDISEFINALDPEERDKIHQKIKSEISREQQTGLLIPLHEFICDKCKKVANVNETCLQYYPEYEDHDPTKPVAMGLQIVHRDNECLYDAMEVGMMMMVGQFTGSDGLANLLGLLEEYPATDPKGEILKIMMRSQLPYYEEARFHQNLIDEDACHSDWLTTKYNRSALRSVVLDAKRPEERKRRKEKVEENRQKLREQGLIDNLSWLTGNITE